MYTRCIFCRTSLGANESIEALPIGRRVAFDAAKGRLWVVCTHCGQWNLTPFEERWEAVETAERLFGDAKRRVSGEQIGLAKLREGLELVRIGKPKRPEFAAWRYGDQFGKRRRDALLVLGGSVIVGGAVVAGGLAVGASVTGVMSIASIIGNASIMQQLRRPLVLPLEDGTQLVMQQGSREAARLVERPASEGGWGIDVEYHRVRRSGEPWNRMPINIMKETAHIAHLSGRDAVHAAERLMSKSAARALGMRRRHIDAGVTLIEDAGGPEQWFRLAAKSIRKWAPDQLTGPTGGINHLPQAVRIALEMAAHEDSERRALDGELATLEARWREAEEIATIADDMFLPASVGSTMARIKRRIADAPDCSP